MIGRALLLPLAVVLAACQSTSSRGAMSLQEAKQVDADFAGPAATRPRGVEGIVALARPAYHARRYLYYTTIVPVPQRATPDALAEFYYRRGLTAGLAGQSWQHISDLQLALEQGRRGFAPITRILYDLAMAEGEGGNAFRQVEHLRRALGTMTYVDTVFSVMPDAMLARAYVAIGDLEAACLALEAADRRWYAGRTNAPEGSHERRAALADAHAAVLNASGRHAEAEALLRKTLATTPAGAEPHPAVDLERAALAETLIHQGRLLEAEHEARQAVVGSFASSLTSRTAHSAWMLRHLAWVLLEQGRFAEAETIARLAIEGFDRAQVTRDSLRAAAARADLARALEAQGRDDDALQEYEEIRGALYGHPRSLRYFFERHTGYAELLLKRGAVSEALPLLTQALERSRAAVGENHAETARIRAALATAHARAGDTPRALQEFRKAAAVLSTRAVEDEPTGLRPVAADARVGALGAYVGFLADLHDSPLARELGIDATQEAFHVADAARGRAVQHALDVNAARTAAGTPALADLLRRKHDARRRLRALYGQVADAATEQGQPAIAALHARLDEQRALLRRLAAQVDVEFPAYAELINPKPVSVERARALLQPGEALITTLVSPERTFVWATPPSGPVAFAAVPVGARELEEMVARLRRALEPHARTLGDVPDFDVAAAHRLYALLLEPVRSGWQDARSLYVVAHGPLGQLPFGLLPTRPATLPAESGLLFSNYRRVPWLARTHAITVLPSVGSLAALRTLPAPTPDRRPFVGFGDPWFSAEQMRTAAGTSPRVRSARLETRSMPITLRSARRTVQWTELANLPPLPDTRAEIQSIAAATSADPGRDVFLGPRANEASVKTLDLAAYRVIAFATHGLLPGELPGLRQPALALSAPDVAGIDGDGVLTTDEILGLRLNADWILLSACNTASGHGTGTEAVSGLGRAFFYAGARALLVSNWPVETTSARALTTGLFRQQSDATRAEALRATLNWMIDHGEAIDGETGKAVFSYAHPIFWAPFSLVGDGGGALAGR
jgi:CHAT domain-containing protein